MKRIGGKQGGVLVMLCSSIDFVDIACDEACDLVESFSCSMGSPRVASALRSPQVIPTTHREGLFSVPSVGVSRV